MWLALFALVTPAIAQSPPLTFPKLTGRVVDDAHLLRPEQQVDINSKLENLEARSGRKLVVVTLPSLQGDTIEDFGYRLGRTWAIGQKGKDDGMLLIVAPNERKVRIEAGYGARVFLTDAISGLIVQDAILPKFRAGDFGGGITAGVDEIVKVAALPPDQAAAYAKQAEAKQQARRDGGGFDPGAIVFIVIFLFFVVIPFLRAMRGGGGRRRGPVILWGPGWGGGGWGGGGGSGWSSGGGSDWGGGGGGFSGGGGSFGGGGASGGW
ncbi:TPM domain-containing protein [Sphingomonas sp. ASV193]|uniref:TPM domain-containing protein n=1 Tax=Sphingomonas sp. ASV193 TaxID=3144405 RepID=UPI0032E89E6F